MKIAEGVLYEATWTAASRKAHKAAGGYFAGPGDTFPLKDASDVSDAWGLAGHAANPDQVRANIKRWAKDNGHYDALPDTAKDDGKQEESVRPKKKIGTLPICWLEYNARSLNGRIYPKATCDRIYESAKRKLADPNALPPTTFVSHEAANGNINTELVGGPTKVWQEGSKFWANIDLADTRVSYDMLGLAEGGYLKSGSMRVLGVELVQDRNYDLPIVVVQEGVEPEFLGIDLTTRPGLADIARIPRVLYESDGTAPYIDTFPLTDVTIETQKGEPIMRIPYFVQAALGTVQEAMTEDRKAHQKVHDHLAGVMDTTIKECHGGESARLMALVEAELSEEGRAIAKVHATRIAAAHDVAAHQLGMNCEGCYNEALGLALDPDTDDGNVVPNDASNREETHHQKGNEPLTEQEMIEALKAKGYSIPEKKTPEQLLQEAFDAKLAEQERKFNERLAALAPVTETQRQTLVLGSGLEESTLKPEDLYQEGDYLKGDLHPKNWRALSDRRTPWPHATLNVKQAIAEMAPIMAMRFLEVDAAARGRHISQMIDPDERI